MALKGIKVVEMAGLAPAPFCGMVLADFGARVVRVDRPHTQTVDVLGNGKQSVIVDLKKKEGASIVRKLCCTADVLLEPYRPGVMEKLGLGPEVLCKDNPGLIYARLTGFGQSGPLAHYAGHDINYIAISGLLSQLGRKGERPYPPINFLADFAGGGLVCALGIVMSLLERQRSGLGQVVDVSMVHGAAYVGSMMWKSRDTFVWGRPRGENLLDGGAAFYNVFETLDGKFISVGALEPQFFAALLQADFSRAVKLEKKAMDHSDINSSASEGCQSCKRRKVPRQTWSPERPTMTQEIAPADYQSSSDSSGCESTSWRSRPSHVKSFSSSNTHLQSNTLPSTNQMPSPSSRLNRTLSQYSLPRPPNSMHASQPSRSPANQYMPGLSLDAASVSQMDDQTKLWQKFQEIFKTKTRDEWSEIFSGLDACVQPVLEMDEAPGHPHNQALGTFISSPHNNRPQPAPAPRLSRTPGVAEVLPQPQPGQDTATVLEESGFSKDEIKQLLKEQVVMESKTKAKL